MIGLVPSDARGKKDFIPDNANIHFNPANPALLIIWYRYCDSI